MDCLGSKTYKNFATTTFPIFQRKSPRKIYHAKLKDDAAATLDLSN